MTHDPTRDCEHGRLKGKCDVCDLQAEAEADKTIIEYHEATIKRLQYEVDAIPAIKEERDALAAENVRLNRVNAELVVVLREAAEALEIASCGGGVNLHLFARDARAALAKATGETR